jgi:glutamate synthase (ferredoxin)
MEGLHRQERDACGIGLLARPGGPADHELLVMALEALDRMAHRGATADDGRTGDGAGVLTALPRCLFLRFLETLGLGVAPERLAAVMLFLPADPSAQEKACALLRDAFQTQGFSLLAWRPVPIRAELLGPRARATCPAIVQALLADERGDAPEGIDRRLYRARRRSEQEAAAEGLSLYVASASCRTIVYKALVLSRDLPRFYPDLEDPSFETDFVIFHQRFSTNTLPAWTRAQPFRTLCHNGEINTLQGNIHGMRAREALLASPLWGDSIEDLRPIIDPEGSDSAMLDNVVEFLVQSGYDIRHALRMLIPEAWEKSLELDEATRGFYAYHQGLMEPWDGPAAVLFTDGRFVGAVLDRNGLRPLRTLQTVDGLLYCGSEIGALEIPPERIRRLDRLGPGQMWAADLRTGRVQDPITLRAELAARRPYAEWVRRHRVRLPEAPTSLPPSAPGVLLRRQIAFGYTAEELALLLRPMAWTGQEPIGSMGDDTPLAMLSGWPRSLYYFFKQRFAQVTNPPIDPLRETRVMSLIVLLGARGNLLDPDEEAAHLVELPGPILAPAQVAALRSLPDPRFRAVVLAMVWPVAAGPAGLRQALEGLCQAAERAIREECALLILSDEAVDAAHAPIPALLAVGALHHHLIRTGQRTRASLIVVSGEPREVHHFACLIGYGASAVCPYLAFETVAALAAREGEGGRAGSPEEAIRRYIQAVEKGLLKVMARMGISTLDAYTGAQIFEIIGLRRELVEWAFTGTPAVCGPVGLEEIARRVEVWHQAAFASEHPQLPSPGFYKHRMRGEFHALNPEAVRDLQEAVRTPDALGAGFPDAYRRYQAFAAHAHRESVDLRDQLRWESDHPPIPLDRVEPEEAILRRFSTAAMSHGALSSEAHETLAIAMNRLGLRSNSGEGGEDPARYETERNSRAKQVASARFGVTPYYLISTEELQIKMAQGSKPGEGGHLPANKVTAEIARLRFAQPGIDLISPPPHHDIYSIEDLAQLIYDLKAIHPRAQVSVKLVSTIGVGVIAAGVAKAGADIVLISGHAGGTGASPWSSIKNAGMPWEVGLAEAHRMLVACGLRDRVRLRVDGGLRTGRDVVIAALLGADEFSFGTIPLVALGCVMARVCHQNTCPTGVATQDPERRAKFTGRPEHVMAYFRMVAHEVREILASMGYTLLGEVIGRTDLLKAVDDSVDWEAVLRPATPPPAVLTAPRVWSFALNDQIVRDGVHALMEGRPMRGIYRIRNVDRTVGARLAGEIARRYREAGLPEGTVTLWFIGEAGQSFGAFSHQGMRLILIGAANDGVGKGLGGGEIIICPPHDLRDPSPVLIGNAALYGATGGWLFAAGRAGDRFAVRNSGAWAVVEGVGDHGCEYMTGGGAVILGPVGDNFGAGMTGGVAYVLDEGEELERRYNPQLVRIDPVEDPQEIAFLQAILERHVQFTGSSRAQRWLACWPEPMARFRRVQPRGLTRIRLPPLDALPAPELAVPMPLDLQGLLHPAPGAHGSLISLK